jgi:formylglycine-generating enzyme required for sulfatase activity
MGSDPDRDKACFPDELPRHDVTLRAYEIARFPVTVAEYACFVRSGQGQPQNWQSQLRKLDHPVVNVNWYDVVAYATWLSHLTRQVWRVPTEAEWEKAARGTDGRRYPWGDTFSKTCCNTLASQIHTTTPVGAYPSGASPYGVYDLAGNVWEWTSSERLPYPYKLPSERDEMHIPELRVLRGGSWHDDARHARTTFRECRSSGSFYDTFGFRLVRLASSS